MTQVFVFSDKDTFQVLTFPNSPEEIVHSINKGDWQSFLGFDPIPEHAWEAMRIGKMVIVYPPIPPEDYPKIVLSPKEYQVLQALCSGLSIDEAAYSLRISVRTVRNRTTVMRLKLNARTIPELTAKATALGIVKPDLDTIPD
jgi:DNA-binding CsgD family transcriptional regulator